MSGNNMESLLMGDDDSSSGESEGEEQVNVPAGGTAASAVAAAPATTPAPAQAPPPAAPAPPPPPAAAPAPSPAASSQADQMARLKSLYQQQPKRNTPTPASGASTPQTTNRSSPAPAPQPQQQQQPPVQQYHQAQPPAARPLQPSRAHPPPAQHIHQAPPPGPQHQYKPPPQQQQQPPPQYHRNPSTSSTSQPRGMPPGGGAPDPYAPTPLNRIQHPMQARPPAAAPPPPAPQNQQPPHAYHRTQAAPPPQARGHIDPERERELRRQKEKFLMFTRVLIKYLEQKDQNLHQQAKLIIKDCADRNRRQEKGYESVTAAMKERLKQLVGDQYWKRAEAYLKHFLEQKSRQQQQQSGGSSSSRPSSSTAPPRTAPQVPPAQPKPKQPPQEKQRKTPTSSSATKTSSQKAAGSPATHPAQKEGSAQKAKPASASGGKGGKSASTGKKAAKRKSTSSAATTPRSSTSTKSAAATTPASAPPAAPAAATPAAAATITPAETKDPDAIPPREYNELMKLIDHAVDFDWTTAGLLLGSKTDIQLTEEQHNLLYNELTGSKKETATEPETPLDNGVRPGWSDRNIVTARNAWALVRLKELKQHKSSQPVVGDTGLTLPSANKPEEVAEKEENKLAAWVNEETAEQDVTLAMISEGAQIYIKGIFEKAIRCARQRQNLDGIRLWHQQCMYAAAQEKEKEKEKENGDDTKKENDQEKDDNSDMKNKPPLAIRLGCDVERQHAQAMGNAAMIVKRMEQALERQSGVPARARVLKDETLDEATSMADLAMRPLLAHGAEKADYHAKRRFEIYGGKDANEPPLGRVPKQAKLESVDLLMGSSIVEPIGRHRASNAAVSMFF